jgi:hypothetical protein
MHGIRLGVVLFVAVLLPTTGNAQAFQFRTPPPEVSAAGAPWQIDGEPVMVNGITYYATHGFRFFDGQIMSQAGTYERVPVYTDVTLEPNSEIYVPIGNGRLRVYERRRDGELAGTTGSHVPAFPAEAPAAAPREASVGTAGSSVPAIAREGAPVLPPDTSTPRRTSILTSVTRPSGSMNGVWLEFAGARWYSDGPAVPYAPERFERAGEYRGFPVYRDRTSPRDRIWVAVVQDGPLAPYARP